MPMPNAGKLGVQVGTYKDWRGRAQCLSCPDVNMITECSNFTVQNVFSSCRMCSPYVLTGEHDHYRTHVVTSSYTYVTSSQRT